MTDTALPAPRRLVPTPARPLLGLTLMIVEDSRYASEAIRQMSLASGARLRRADTLAAAHRHLALYAPSVCVVDLCLPDGDGASLIADLARRGIPTLATSGDDQARDAALAAGADAFVEKPLGTLAAFQQAILALLPPEVRPRGPRLVDVRTPPPDPLAYLDDLGHALSLLRTDPDASACRYVARFVAGVARCAGDADAAEAAIRLADAVETDTRSLGGALESLRACLTARVSAPRPI